MLLTTFVEIVLADGGVTSTSGDVSGGDPGGRLDNGDSSSSSSITTGSTFGRPQRERSRSQIRFRIYVHKAYLR